MIESLWNRPFELTREKVAAWLLLLIRILARGATLVMAHPTEMPDFGSGQLYVPMRRITYSGTFSSATCPIEMSFDL